MDCVAGLSQHVRNQIVCSALALAYDFSLFSRFLEFLGSTVKERKQNSLSHTRVALWSDTQDTRGYPSMLSEADAANNMTASPATWDSSRQLSRERRMPKATTVIYGAPKAKIQGTLFKPETHWQEGGVRDLKTTIKLSALHGQHSVHQNHHFPKGSWKRPWKIIEGIMEILHLRLHM